MEIDNGKISTIDYLDKEGIAKDSRRNCLEHYRTTQSLKKQLQEIYNLPNGERKLCYFYIYICEKGTSKDFSKILEATDLDFFDHITFLSLMDIAKKKGYLDEDAKYDKLYIKSYIERIIYLDDLLNKNKDDV